MDAFSFEWSQTNLYAFPPFAVVGRVIEKLIEDRATALLIVPYWPAQPWFADYVAGLIEPPFYFEMSNENLVLPFRRTSRQTPQAHPLAGETQLLIATFSGERCDATAWGTGPPRSSWRPGHRAPPRATTACGRRMPSFVWTEGSIPLRPLLP